MKHHCFLYVLHYLLIHHALQVTVSLAYGLDSAPKAIVIDTDIFSDVDDVGALAVANVLHNCGFADLKAVMINTNSKYGALAASAVNTYFGNRNVPIGAMKPLTEETFVDRYYYRLGEYASKVAYNFPHMLDDPSKTETPTGLYRKVLESAANTSLTLISIGFLTNLAALLKSGADETSGLTGAELIEAKVAELVIMGGRYPSGWEFNFGGVDPESALFVLTRWPNKVPITFSGYELGARIYSGGRLSGLAPANSPVLAAYQWYGDRCNTTAKSYDPVTVLYGVLGLDGFSNLGIGPPFEFANEHGYNTIAIETGMNAWVDDRSVTNQHWLKLKRDMSPDSVAWLLDHFYASGPAANASSLNCCPASFRLYT